MVSNLFVDYAMVLSKQKTHVRKDSTVTRRFQPSTVAAKFQLSLMELIQKIERSQDYLQTINCAFHAYKCETLLFGENIRA